MNKVILSGRLISAIELKTSDKTKKQYCRFTLSIKKGETIDYIELTAFEHSANYLSKYSKKGDFVEVEGRLQNSSFEKEGKKIYKLGVVADAVSIISQNKKAESEDLENEEYEEIEESE